MFLELCFLIQAILNGMAIFDKEYSENESGMFFKVCAIIYILSMNIYPAIRLVQAI